MKIIINKGYKFRLYPTEEQKQLLLQHVGNTRFIWNYFLNLNKQEYEKNKQFIFGYELIKLLPALKKQKEFEFLKISSAYSLQQVGLQFEKALKSFIKKEKGFPVYHKKLTKDSFITPQYFKINKKTVTIPKIGEIEWKKHQNIKGKPKSITISQDGDLWFCSVNCELKITKKEPKQGNIENFIGIDVGLKEFAVTNQNTIIHNPKYLIKAEKKLKLEQKRLSRKRKYNKTTKTPASNNYNKQKSKLQKQHRKVRNQRNDFLHKQSSSMIAKCDGIAVENLNIQGMMKNHNLAKAIADVGWGEFKRQLKYKCQWNGKSFIEIDRFEPTSKCCSQCGWKKIDLSLKDRTFHCDNCNLLIDRDLNAAINIRNVGYRLLWDTQEASASDSVTGTLGEIGGCRVSQDIQCLSENQEQIYVSPNASSLDCILPLVCKV